MLCPARHRNMPSKPERSNAATFQSPVQDFAPFPGSAGSCSGPREVFLCPAVGFSQVESTQIVRADEVLTWSVRVWKLDTVIPAEKPARELLPHRGAGKCCWRGHGRAVCRHTVPRGQLTPFSFSFKPLPLRSFSFMFTAMASQRSCF